MTTSKTHLHELAVLDPMNGRETPRFVRRDPKVRVLHPQGREETLLEELIDRHAGQDFHQACLDVRPNALDPLRTKLIPQR
jgi:hypothetical protein